MPKKVLANRLKLARKELGVSQFELGVRIGVDEATAKSRVSHYENAVNVPTLATLQKLAIALEKPLSWFFCNDDELELLDILNKLEAHIRAERMTELLSMLQDK